ncbi:MAG: hydrolase [Frankiales bacterium]|jgi:8-oxo-dGTP pyrophosphatase MutT (NUDIX family)|nr:hydrolase [Frankiales bacterium]
MTRTRLPASFADRVRQLASGEVAAAPARDASTVALLRDGEQGPEVYLLRRVKGMAFAGGMHVFPGGAVDPADATADIAWAGPPPSVWAAAFACDEPLARALVCAAVRETFEESGVLLAGPDADEVLADVSNDDWEAERAALEAREHSMSELLARRSLVLRSDLLRPLAHWITPEFEPKRFDTRFFLARMPEGQVCREVGGEADERRWLRPAEALASADRPGGTNLLPPTSAVLQDLAAHPDVTSALGATRVIRTVLPSARIADDGAVELLVQGGPDPA